MACPEEQAEQVAIFTEEIMVAGVEEVLNSGLGTDHPERAPVKVVVDVVDRWGEG